MKRIDLSKGQQVTVKSDDGGLMHGRVAGFEKDGKEAVITPDEPALERWYPKGYKIGAAHWGTYLLAHPNGAMQFWRNNKASEPFVMTFEEIAGLWSTSDWPETLMPLDRKLRIFLADPKGPVSAAWEDEDTYDRLLSYISDLAQEGMS